MSTILSPVRLAMLTLFGFAVLCAATAPTPHNASADDWCFNDPIVSVNGQQIQIVTGIQGSATAARAIGNPLLIQVYVPAGAQTEIISVQHQFFTELVQFVPTNTTNTVKVAGAFQSPLAAATVMPSQMQVTFTGTTNVVSGTTAAPLTWSASLS